MVNTRPFLMEKFRKGRSSGSRRDQLKQQIADTSHCDTGMALGQLNIFPFGKPVGLAVEGRCCLDIGNYEANMIDLREQVVLLLLRPLRL